MQTALLAHSSKSTTTFTDTSCRWLNWLVRAAWLRRAYRQGPGSGLVCADDPHGEELGTTTVGLAERRRASGTWCSPAIPLT